MKFNSTNANSGNSHCSDVSIAIGASNKKDDYFPTCSNCNLEIKDKYYTKLLDRSWHNSCFVCCACKTKLGSKCYSRDGFIFCHMDFQTQAWTLCSGCNRSITPDELVQRIHDYIFHVSCLTCSICKAHLQTGDKIFIVHGYPCKVYCHNDYKQYVIGRNSSESAKVMPAGGQWTSPAVHQAYNQQFPHRQMPADYGYPQPPSLDNSRGVFRPTPLPATSRNHPQISNVHPQSQPLQPQQQPPAPAPPHAPVTGMAVASPGSNTFPCQPIAQHPPNYKQQSEALKQPQHAQPPQINTTQTGHPQIHNGHVMAPRYKEEHAMSPSAPHSARSPNLAGGFEGIQPPFMPQGHHMPVAGNLTNGVAHHGYLQGQAMQQSPAQSSDSNSVDMIEYRPSSQQSLPPNRASQGSGVPAASMGGSGGVLTNNSSAFSPCPGNNASNVNQQQTAQPPRGFAPPGTQQLQQPHQTHLYANGGVPPGVVAHPKMLPPHIVCDDEKSSDNVSVSSENDLQCSPKSGASMGSSSGGTNSNPNSVSSAANTPPASTQSGGGAATPPTSAKRGPGNHLKGPQAEFLRSYYLTNQKPSKEEREAIAAEIGVEAKTIATWFQNRRSKEKIKREKAAAAAASAGMDQNASENSQSSSVAHSPPASLEPSSLAPPPPPLPSSQPGTANHPSNAPVLTQEAISQSMTNNINHQANNATTSHEHQPASPAVAHLSENSGYSSYVIKDSNQTTTNDFNMNAQNPQPNDSFHHSNFGFAKIESNSEQFQMNQSNFDHNGASANDQGMEFSTSGHYYVTNDVTQQYPTQTAVPPPQNSNDATGSNEPPYSVVQSVPSSAFKSFNTAQTTFTSSPAQPQFASVVSQTQNPGPTTFVPAQ